MTERANANRVESFSENELWKKIKSFWSVYKTTKIGLVGLVIVSSFVFIALFAPFIAPYNPMRSVDEPLLPPSLSHLLGTDQLGRDIFSGLIHGTRISLMVGALASAMYVIIGTLIGVLSGYYGGIVDSVLMRITDTFIILPTLPLMLIIISFLGTGIHVIIIVIAVLTWTGTARMVRAQTLSLKERPFVEAAKAIGAKDFRIIFHHILPNTLPVIFANAILGVVDAILAEAGISFLGYGDPFHLSWGMILNYAQKAGALVTGRYWYIISPGLCITLLTAGFAFVSYGLDQVLNPRLRRR